MDWDEFWDKAKRNLKILAVAINLVIFYYAVSGILKNVTDNSTSYTTYFLLLAIPLLYFLSNDGVVSELVGHDYAAIGGAAS